MNETIAAISTASGEGGIAVIRVSGPDAVNISRKVLTRQSFDEPAKMYLTSLIDDEGRIIDRVLAVNFVKPKSYTGEDIVEIHTHGGSFIARICLELLIKNGARIAEPGEFTRRAFINGRIDLAQAEGVLSVIKSRSMEALHAAARTLTGELSRETRKIHDEILALQANFEIQLDFPEGETLNNFDAHDDIKKIVNELEGLYSQCSAGMILRDGVRAVIIGSPNVGKSSLLNALLRRNRAIVTEIPGTTRDIIEESIIINGVTIRLADTAGLRDADDKIEAEGVKLALEAMNESDICLYVLDSSREITQEELNFIGELDDKNVILVLNKSDLPRKVDDEALTISPKIYVSAKNLTGLDELKGEIYKLAAKNSAFNSGLNVSERQLEDLRECLNSMREAELSIDDDVTAGLLNSARLSLMRLLGVDAGDELLDEMFNRFCVGK
ncbi:MAG: tRNA uridine-5-carboxymethylaminomethyl(34) synthesis GTPase MnmE [Synergistaceae bacterium]|nr:tRNA uridine-5-carboxymethylaminomethyl(34) synthesis GTPase MnmE [Synergistaceae bacterium]